MRLLYSSFTLVLACAGKGVRSPVAYFPGVDNVLKAGFDKGKTYATNNISLIYSPWPDIYKSGSSLTVQTFTKDLICDVVIFTSHDKFTQSYAELDEWRKAYAARQRDSPTCLFNINSEKRFKTPLSRAANFDRHLERYRGALILNYLVDERKIRTSDGAAAPWILYVDGDVAFTNYYLSIEKYLVERITTSLAHITAEQRVCGQYNNPFTCLPDQTMKPPASVDQVGFVIAPEMNCFDKWGVNSGVWLYKPSRLSAILFTSILAGRKYKVKHEFHGMDQGYMNWALAEIFGLEHERLRNFCLPYDSAYWDPSIDGKELLFTRQIKPKIQQPLLRKIVDFYMPSRANNTDEVTEPTYVAYVNPRWMNAPGCPWVMAHPQRADLAWHPGDFAVHFNSCHAAGFRTPEFRAKADAGARDIMPHPDGYNWNKQWLAEQKPFNMGKQRLMTLSDPPCRPWECADTTAEAH